MKRMITIACAVLLAPALAAAQPKTPEDWYKEGETQYNLGNFDKAVEAFKAGFAAEPNDSKKAAYLYNIAQSYRQAKDCTNAVFFYKRYLALKDSDTTKPLAPAKRQEIEDRIKELDECAKQQEAIRNKPPVDTSRPTDGDPNNTGKQTDANAKNPNPNNKQVAKKPNPNDDDDDEGDVHKKVTPLAPHVISARLLGGGAKINTGDLAVPIQATGALIAGYPIPVAPKARIEPGLGFTFTPVPFEQMGTNASKTAQFIGVVANVGGVYEVAPKISLRGDVGAGLLAFSGVSESPFTNNQPTSGALSMFHFRIGVSADYAVTPNVVLTAAPLTFSYSPAKAGLREDITSITAIDFMVGLGYRM